MFDKKMETGSGGGMFVKLKDGQFITGVLAGEVKFYEKIWKDRPDQPTQRFKMNLLVKENGAISAKILDQGPSVWNQLVDMKEAGYNLLRTTIKISRKGSGKFDTEYTIMPIPNGVIDDISFSSLAAVKLNDLEKKESGPEKGPLAKPQDDLGSPPQWTEDDVPF